MPNSRTRDAYREPRTPSGAQDNVVNSLHMIEDAKGDYQPGNGGLNPFPVPPPPPVPAHL